MEAAPVVTLIAVALAVLVIALFLITVTYQLHQVSSRLNTILSVVVDVGEKTAPLEPVINEIATDLTGAHEAIDGAVARLKERKGYSDATNGAAPGAVPPSGPPPTTFNPGGPPPSFSGG
jgi:hypothetical protein